MALAAFLALLAPAAAGSVPETGQPYLSELARDTWKYFAECSDPVTGLVWDHSGDAGSAEYSSPTNIGLSLVAAVAAADLGIITNEQSGQYVRRALDSIGKLETAKGFYHNFYDTRTLKSTNDFLSFVDNAWLSLSLAVVREAFDGDIRRRVDALMAPQDYGTFYDPKRGLMYHGFHEPKRADVSYGHYTMLSSEHRAGSVWAISKGDVPASHWFRLDRAVEKPGKGYEKGEQRTYEGVRMQQSYYTYCGVKVVPSWGGAMFEFLMPTLFIDEAALAPRSLGINNRRVVDAHIAFSRERGSRLWGLSPSADPDGGYAEYGAAPVAVSPYGDDAVSPHASILALELRPAAVLANTEKIEAMPGTRGKYGLYDAVDPKTGKVAERYLALDQGMIILAIDNYLNDGAIRRRLMGAREMKRAARLLGQETFY